MNNQAFLLTHINNYCYNYIKNVYKEHIYNNNDNKDLEEFEVSIFIEDSYNTHKEILKEQLLIDITKNHKHLLDEYHNISNEIFEDDDYNKGILYEKICLYKQYPNHH